MMFRGLCVGLLGFVCAVSAQAQESGAPSIALAYIHNGEIKHDKSIMLRERKDAIKILKALSPVNAADPAHSIWNAVPLKPALSAQKRQEYVTLAWQAYEDVDADLINIIHGAPNPGGPYSNNRKSYLSAIQKVAFSVIGAYGAAGDIPKLLDVAFIQRENGSVYIQDVPLVAASTIQGRLGLSGDVFVEKSASHLPNEPYIAAAYAWAGSLYGDKKSADALLKINQDHYDVLKKPGMWFMVKSVRALAAVSVDGAALEFMRTIADEYNAAVAVADVKTIQSLPATLSWAMPYVMAYLQAYGDESDVVRLNVIKILRKDYAPILLALAQYPVPVAAMMVDTAIEPKYSRKKLGFDYYCAGLFNRNSKESFQFYDEFKTLWLDSQPPHSDPQARDMYANSYELEMARCHASATAARLVAGGKDGDLYSNYWIKPNGFPAEISQAVSKMQGNVPIFSVGYLAHDVVKANLSETKYTNILLAYHELVDTQHIVPIEVASGTRRGFVRTVNEDSTTLSGLVDVAPRVSDGVLQVGIRLSIDGAIDSSQGFAQAISGESYDIVATQEKGGLPLIDIVSLETIADKKQMKFVRTTKSGVHIFETPYEGDGSNGWVEVFLAAAGDRWAVNVPLYRHLSK